MGDKDNKKYIKMGITGVAVIAVSLLGFFLLFRIQDVLGAVRMLTGILMPFVYGAVIAYILTPVCKKAERLLIKIFRPKKKNSALLTWASIGLALIFALLLAAALIMLVIPQVWRSLAGIAVSVPGQLESANAWFHDLLKSRPDIQTYWDQIAGKISGGIIEWLRTSLLPTMGSMVGEIGSRISVFAGVVSDLFLGMLISVYIMASRRQLAAQAKLLLNGIFSRRWAELIEEEVRYADRMFNGFLMGKLLDSTIIGILCFIGTSLLGIRSAALVSVIVGVTNMIPFFGPYIGAIPSALLLLLENPLHCVYFVIFVTILQQLDGNVIGPKILGDSTGLSSFWVLFSILLFGGLWGIVGMIIGVPLFAVLYDVARKLTYLGLKKHRCEEMIEEYNVCYHPEEGEKDRKDP